MKRDKTKTVHFRRKRKGKTNYRRRLKLLVSGRLRFVIRKCHPIRISIVKVVHEEGPVSFSGMMKALNIESSNLGFHLKQLETFLARDDNGNYVLSEKGRVSLKALAAFEIVKVKLILKKTFMILK